MCMSQVIKFIKMFDLPQTQKDLRNNYSNKKLTSKSKNDIHKTFFMNRNK